MSSLSGGVNLAAEIIGLIELAGSVGTELYLKLQAIGQLSADEQANIAKAIADAITVDDDTNAQIDAWKTAVGLTVQPATAPLPTGASTGTPVPPATEPQK